MWSRDAGGDTGTLRVSSQEKNHGNSEIHNPGCTAFRIQLFIYVPHWRTRNSSHRNIINHQFKDEKIFGGEAEKNRNTFEDDCREGRRVSR